MANVNNNNQPDPLIQQSATLLHHFQAIINERADMNIQEGDWLMTVSTIAKRQNQLLLAQRQYIAARQQLLQLVEDYELLVDELYGCLY